MIDVVGMVVHYVKDDTDAGLVKGLHHLLKFTNASSRVSRISRIAALRHIVVNRVVAPVILRLVETCLVNRTIVIAGQDMDGIDTQRLQMTECPPFCQC